MKKQYFSDTGKEISRKRSNKFKKTNKNRKTNGYTNSQSK